MSSKTKSFFKKLLSSVLSAACLVSGTAVMSAAIGSAVSEANLEAHAANPDKLPAFSWDNATVYFLLTDRFKNGDTSNDHAYGRGMNNGSVVNYDMTGSFMGGDFKGITQAIEEGYFDDLGVNAIWLSAPYEQVHGYCVAGEGDSFAHYAYHGYYVLDYTEPDLNFGTKADFKEMVDTAHLHGIRIVMDIVMNHSGYNTMQDMYEFGFGELKSGWDTYYYAHQNVNNSAYHGFINYSANANPSWSDWWGPNWIRCGLPNYNTYGQGPSEQIECLSGLPDFRTESSNLVGIPKFLQTKWEKEGTLEAKQKKYTDDTVTGHISTWLAEWVEEFGVDGFRCDTAKHVGKTEWGQLKAKCVAALKQWRQNNPSAVGADWTDDFWMTGEHFGHSVEKDDYYTTGGFDSMINFDFAPSVNNSLIPSASQVESIYSRYASSINSDPSFNVLTYLASHDTTLIKGDRKYAGSFLLMCPGGIQIYYGDETGRPLDTGAKANADANAGHQLRTFMNWGSIDDDILSHWQKVGQFRNNHLAVGAGAHSVISNYNSSTGYTFSRTYKDDKIVATLFAPVNMDITVDVSGVFADGTDVENFYDNTTGIVTDGKVTFNSGANGTILIQPCTEKRGRVAVTHFDSTRNKVIKTETLSGTIGQSYAVEPLDLFGYTNSSVEGDLTGTFSEEQNQVTIYYTLNDGYAYLTVKYVDAASNSEIAESEEKVYAIGSSYASDLASMQKSIKNYELDADASDLGSGTISETANIVTFRYNYVKPSYLKVHYYNANNWSSVYMYAYTGTDSTLAEPLGGWPGTAMTSESNNWYVLEVPEVESARVLFSNNDSSQEPGAGVPGYELAGEVWLKNKHLLTPSKVNILYVTTGGEILASETLNGFAGDPYATEAKEFDDYELTATPENASGTFGSETITITYTYSSSVPEPAPLTNDSTLSAESIELGQSLTVNASAQGGTAPYQYNALYKLSSSSEWTTAQAYSDNDTIVITPADPGQYDLCVNVKDSNDNVDEKDFTFSVTAPLTNNSQISAESIELGQSLTVNASAQGGTAPYQYNALYKLSSSSEWTTAQAYSDNDTIVITPADPGQYDLCVNVKDSNDNVDEKDFTFSVTAPLTNNSQISAESIFKGESVTFTGAASGGTEPYQFAYVAKAPDGKWYVLKNYSTDTSHTWKPASLGKYTLQVKVKDSKGTVEIKSFNLTVSTLTNNSTISATSVAKGQSVILTGSATGGAEPYQFAYVACAPDGKWSVLKNYSTDTSYTWTPASLGKYTVQIKVKDSKGKVEVKSFALTVSAIANTSTISATSIAKGQSIKLTASASGGTEPYQFAYVAQAPDGKWYVLKNYSTATSHTWKPASLGKYTVQVKVKDSEGKVEIKSFTLTVSDLTNTSTISSTSITKGQSIDITASATGGTEPYQFAYVVQAPSGSWTVLKNYSTATSHTWKPASLGKYTVQVKAKDKDGAIVIKSFTLSVNS